MTPEIINGIIQAYGFPAAFAAWLWWNARNAAPKNDPTKALFEKLDRIESDVHSLKRTVDQIDNRADTAEGRLIRLETRDEMRGRDR